MNMHDRFGIKDGLYLAENKENETQQLVKESINYFGILITLTPTSPFTPTSPSRPSSPF